MLTFEKIYIWSLIEFVVSEYPISLKKIWRLNMKKIILSLLCLLIISLGVACAAASDNTTVTHDSIQTIDQQHITC